MPDNKQRIERMMTHLTGFDQDEARGFINDFMEEIKEPLKRVPENVFREIFLPVFAGLDPDLEKRTQEFSVHWAGVVGSPTAQAEVVDVQGNKLFTVPPLYDTSRMASGGATRGSGSYAGMFTELVETASVNPIAAQGAFAMAASKKLDSVIKKDMDDNNPWTEVFSYYGLIAKPGDAATAKPTKSIDDDFIFE